MFDDLFSWFDPVVEPLIEPVEEGLLDLVAPLGGMQAFLEHPGEILWSPVHNVSQETYKAMCLSLYQYRAGSLGFLDLLSQFEQALGIGPAQMAGVPSREDVVPEASSLS